MKYNANNNNNNKNRMYLLNYILKLQVLCKNCIVWTVLVALYFCFVYVRECSIMWECGRRQRRRTWILRKIVSGKENGV